MSRSVVQVGIKGPKGDQGIQGIPGPAGSVGSIIQPDTSSGNGHSQLQGAFDAAVTGDEILPGSIENDNGSTGQRITVGDGKQIFGGFVTSDFGHDEPTFNIQGSGIIFNQMQLSVNFATAIQVASSVTANNIMFLNMIITAVNGYALLDNDGTNASDGLIIAGCIITSVTADAVEFNNPAVGHKNRLLYGCILESQGVPPSGSAGFPIGVAGIDGFMAGMCMIKNARAAAVHIEDVSNRGVIGMLSVSDCKQGGLTVQVPVPSKGFPTPNVYGLLNMRHTGTKTGFNGFTTIGDNNGNVNEAMLVASCFDGFDYAYALADTVNAHLFACMAKDCNNTIFGSKHARSFGVINSKNTPNMMLGQAGVILEGVNSLTTVTNILQKNGTNFPGPMCEYWGQPSASFTHPGTGTPQFTICKMPSGCTGYMSVRVEGSPRGFLWFGKLKWDGTTLTVGGSSGTDKTELYNGAISAFVPSVDGSGNLQFTFFTNSSMTNIFRIEFGRPAAWVQF